MGRVGTWCKHIAVVGLLTASAAGWSQDAPSAAEIIGAVDTNMTSASSQSQMKMIVQTTRRTREFEMKTFSRGQTDSAFEYLSPARDKGTKMLKLGDDLWIYLPSVEREQKISGHMMRQGMMGSDFSYEDLMESRKLLENYDAVVEGTDTVEGHACWKLVLTAKNDTVPYAKRISWIDKEKSITLKQELYALSGMHLKTWSMSDIKRIGERWYPMKMTIQDHLKKGSSTTVVFVDIQFGIDTPDEIFRYSWLSQ